MDKGFINASNSLGLRKAHQQSHQTARPAYPACRRAAREHGQSRVPSWNHTADRLSGHCRSEHAVGVRLLDRSTQGVVSTVYGDILLKRGAESFDTLKQALREI